MNKGIEIARGKTKILYEHPDNPDQLVVKQTDAITAGDGARRHEIPGKGRLAAQTTARVFRLLNLCGLPTHYLSGGEDDDANEMLVRRCAMIPLEVVVRGVAAGSLVRRNPTLVKGTPLVPRVVEFFLKDDAAHDPLIGADEIVARSIADPNEVATMSELARLTFEILSHAWRRRNVLLVDLKVEFGRLVSGEGKGQLVLADVIDNDAWRIWPQGREELMLDKQLYRNLDTVDSQGLDRVREAYERVANLTSDFPVMRPAAAAVIAAGSADVEPATAIAQALGQFGLPVVRRVADPVTTPGFVLQAVQQLEAALMRVVFVAVGDRALKEMLEYAAASPVLDGRDDPRAVALRAAKILGVDDTVSYGRVLLMQAALRSAVLHADAALQQPSQPPAGTLA